MNPLEYGYIEDDNMIIVPDIVIKEVVPEDFPMPCLYCARSNQGGWSNMCMQNKEHRMLLNLKMSSH